LFKGLLVHHGREQRLAGTDNPNLLEPLTFLPGCGLFVELVLGLRKEGRHRLNQAWRQQLLQLLFG
jgi:hypothetical protein